MENIYCVSGSSGFVIAFTSKEKAENFIKNYPNVPFIVESFKGDPNGDPENIWLSVQQDNGLMIFASNNQETTQRVHDMRASVGHVYPDDVKYWKYKIGTINNETNMRLELEKRVLEEFVKAETEPNNFFVPEIIAPFV